MTRIVVLLIVAGLGTSSADTLPPGVSPKAAAIVDRIDTGETVGALAEDYDLSRKEIEQAVCYSRAA